MLTQNETSRRESQSKALDIRIKMVEFQLKTLLEVQEVMSSLNHWAAREFTYHHGLEERPESEDVNEGYPLVQEELKRLRVRVADDRARELLLEFDREIWSSIRSPGSVEDVIDAEESSLAKAFELANERVGELIREMRRVLEDAPSGERGRSFGETIVYVMRLRGLDAPYNWRWGVRMRRSSGPARCRWV